MPKHSPARLARTTLNSIKYEYGRAQRAPDAQTDKLRDGAYLQALLTEVGVTQAFAAQRLGIDARTMRRYLADECPIPYLVQYALENLAASHPAQLERAAG